MWGQGSTVRLTRHFLYFFVGGAGARDYNCPSYGTQYTSNLIVYHYYSQKFSREKNFCVYYRNNLWNLFSPSSPIVYVIINTGKKYFVNESGWRDWGKFSHGENFWLYGTLREWTYTLMIITRHAGVTLSGQLLLWDDSKNQHTVSNIPSQVWPRIAMSMSRR